VASARAQLRARVTAYWREQGVVPAGKEEERLDELVLVAMTKVGKVLYVCSGQPLVHETLGIPFHELRLLTRAGLRHRRLASNAILTAFRKLGENNRSLSTPEAVGLIFF